MRSLLGVVLQGAEGGNGPPALAVLSEQWRLTGPGGSIAIFGTSMEPRVDRGCKQLSQDSQH